MFQEEIADITAAHLRTHINGYFDDVRAIYQDGVTLILPKAIETANLVGGVYSVPFKDLPSWGIDILNKQFLGVTPEDLNTFGYNGHIAGIVSGASENAANKLVKRHEQVAETFVRDHLLLHGSGSALGNQFLITELDFIGAAFSGAELVDESDDRQVWVAGFRIDLVWTTSELSAGQH